MTRWPKISEIDGETEQLIYLAEDGWSYQWPGWDWISYVLNDEYKNSRTPTACRSKYKRLTKEAIK